MSKTSTIRTYVFALRAAIVHHFELPSCFACNIVSEIWKVVVNRLHASAIDVGNIFADLGVSFVVGQLLGDGWSRRP